MIRSKSAIKWLLLFCFATTVGLSSNCRLNYISHDPKLAAETAFQFSELVFLKKDYESAMLYLPDDRDPTFSPKMLESMINFTHSMVPFPQKVELISHRIVPGQGQLEVFLKGSVDGNVSGYYRIVLRKNNNETYSVLEFYANEKDFPEYQDRVQY